MREDTPQVSIIQEKFRRMAPFLNERSKRLWCATEAKALGRGGKAMVHRATGVSWPTITKGLAELEASEGLDVHRVRHQGGGRKKISEKDKTLLRDLDRLIEPATRGDPESSLRWSSKSTPKLAQELCSQGHKVSQKTVYRLLDEQEYSLKSNRKRLEGSKDNPDRDGQFNLINDTAKKFQAKNCPVLSVDAKKKENIGLFKNNGREWSKKGQHTDVNVYDFIDKQKGKAAPYGVYDMGENKAWVSVGISSDTAEFAVESIRTWWYEMGKDIYANADEILITADCGGSNGNRVRLWKYELQLLANEINKSITVCHFPPGTSKWNKIEHRLFCQITQNWRGKPLVDLQTIVELIGNTSTTTGLTVKTKIDPKTYQKGRKISKALFGTINLKTIPFHPEWNYTIFPNAD
jgi:Rhodopirellula transposase DDE domain